MRRIAIRGHLHTRLRGSGVERIIRGGVAEDRRIDGQACGVPGDVVARRDRLRHVRNARPIGRVRHVAVEGKRRRGGQRRGIDGVLRLVAAKELNAVVDDERADRGEHQQRRGRLHDDGALFRPDANAQRKGVHGRNVSLVVPAGGRNCCGSVGIGGACPAASGCTRCGVMITTSSVRSFRSALLLNR